MSKNNKNARKIKAAKDRKGVKGPARTSCLNSKPRAWFRLGNNNAPKKPGDRKRVDTQAQSE